MIGMVGERLEVEKIIESLKDTLVARRKALILKRGD
jgi:hypothetical protein